MAENTTTFDGSISLGSLRKKRFSIEGTDKVLELNTSDFGILSRFNEAYPKITKIAQDNIGFDGLFKDDAKFEEDLNSFSAKMTEHDKSVRDLVDYIFDSNVSELCAPFGSMFDPIDGILRFEHIISTLTPLYEENLSKEMKRIEKRSKQHTSKYTGK